jgi:peroxiredoxin
VTAVVLVLLVAVLVLVSMTLVSFWLLLYQVIKQQGRLLIRLDALEARLLDGVQIGVSRDGDGSRTRTALPVGLPVGTAVERLQLTDLDGKIVDLEDFRGKRVLLINWNPQCGFCDLIAPDLAKLLPDLRSRQVELVLLSCGEPEANRNHIRRHGLESRILLPKDEQSIEVFQQIGTPAAYLLDERGKVAKPLATGADQVLALAREVAVVADRKRLPGERPLSESRILRAGLKAGTPAPRFSLPDINGRTISLEEYRGRRVLLVFTDPRCGPCDQLAPDLVRLHLQDHNDDLALVMVGRGEAEENLRKAKEHGIQFPVVLQKRWEVSREYGMFATPAAFLIGEDGVIARDVAQGRDEILALVQAATPAGKERANGPLV